HRLIATSLHPRWQQILQWVGPSRVGIGIAIDVAALLSRSRDPLEDLPRLAPIVDPRTFEMHDLDMDATGAGNFNGLLHPLHDLVRLVPDVREITRIVSFQESTEGHHFVWFGKAARRGKQARRHAERAGA